MDYAAVHERRTTGDSAAQCFPGDRHAVQVQKILQFHEQRTHAARCVEILHVVAAGRFEIQQNGCFVGQAIQALERYADAATAGNRGQMNDRVGRAADREQHAQCVLDRLVRNDLRRPRTFGPDHFHRAHARGFGRAYAVSVHCGDRRRVGKGHTQCLGDAGHGARRSHHRARAGGGGEVALDFVYALVADFAGAKLCPESAAIGAGAQAFAPVGHCHHRPGHKLDCRHVGGGCAHQLRRHRLVAAADQHHRIHRLRPYHFLNVHGHEVAEHEAGRAEEYLAQRNGRKIDRQPASPEYSALDRLG